MRSFKKFLVQDLDTGRRITAFYPNKRDMAKCLRYVGVKRIAIEDERSCPPTVTEEMLKEFPHFIALWGGNPTWNYNVYERILCKGIGIPVGKQRGDYLVRDVEEAREACKNIVLQMDQEYHNLPKVGTPLFWDEVWYYTYVPRRAESRRKMHEHFVHKDGIWIMPFSGLHADAVKVEIWIDDKNVHTEDFYYGYHKNGNANLIQDALEYAHKVSKENNLPIYDGSGVEYYTFPREYCRTNTRDNDDWKPIVDDPDVIPYEYTDQEVDDMDERPRQTAKWAILTEPGKFNIYDNVTKNPNRLWDTQLYRGLAGYEGDRQKELRTFFQKNADKVYQGTWADIKDGNYTVLVNNRIYESRDIAEKFKAILDAGLKIDGHRISGSVVFGKKTDDMGYEVEDKISLDTNIKNFSCGEYADFTKKLTVIYDALTCAGVAFPHEFTISTNSEERDEWDRRKSYEYTVQITDSNQVIIGKTDKLKKYQELQVGDVLKAHHDNGVFSGGEAPLYVVIETDGAKKAKIARCSISMQVNDSIWGHNYAQILSPRLYQNAMNGTFAKRGDGKIDDVYTINLLTTDFSIAYTKEAVKDALKSGMQSISQNSNRYDNKGLGYETKNMPDNPEEFFGEPYRDVLLTSWEKQDRAKAKDAIPKVLSIFEDYMARGKLKKTDEQIGDAYDDIGHENKYTYEGNGVTVVLELDLRRSEYGITCLKGGDKHCWSGWSTDEKDLTNDLENLLNKYVLTKQESRRYAAKYAEKDLDRLFESFDNPKSYLDL